MLRKRVAIVIVSLFTTILFIGCSDDGPSQSVVAPPIGLLGLDGLSSKSGNSFLGKPLVIDFWATWCGPCKIMMPDVGRLSEQYGDKVNVIGVSNEDRLVISKFWKSAGLPYPAYVDVTGTTESAFQIKSLPTMVIIDQVGNMIFKQSPPDVHQARVVINDLLAHPPVKA